MNNFKLLLYIILFPSILSGAIQNQSPVVNAGADITTKISSRTFLNGTVMDDSTSEENLNIRWSQIKGPQNATLTDSTSAFTRVTFLVVGNYSFVLSVVDQNGLKGSDTIQVTVIEQLPFIITSPTEGQQIEIGSTFTIKWQMDPSEACRVYLSIDEGKSRRIISDAAKSDSMVWTVDEDLIPTNKAILYLDDYASGSKVTSIRFELVAKGGIGTIMPLSNSRKLKIQNKFKPVNLQGKSVIQNSVENVNLQKCIKY